MAMTGHMVWAQGLFYTVQNMSFMMKVVKGHEDHLIVCPTHFENGVGYGPD